MNKKQKTKEIKKTLNYLISEGFVKQVGDKFRLKTDNELKKEIKTITQ